METTDPTTKAVANTYAVSVTDAAAGSAFHSPGTDPALSHTLHTVLAQLLGDLEVDMIYLTRRGTADRNKFVMYGVQAGYSALASAPQLPGPQVISTVFGTLLTEPVFLLWTWIVLLWTLRVLTVRLEDVDQQA